MPCPPSAPLPVETKNTARSKTEARREANTKDRLVYDRMLSCLWAEFLGPDESHLSPPATEGEEAPLELHMRNWFVSRFAEAANAPVGDRESMRLSLFHRLEAAKKGVLQNHGRYAERKMALRAVAYTRKCILYATRQAKRKLRQGSAHSVPARSSV